MPLKTIGLFQVNVIENDKDTQCTDFVLLMEDTKTHKRALYYSNIYGECTNKAPITKDIAITNGTKRANINLDKSTGQYLFVYSGDFNAIDLTYCNICLDGDVVSLHEKQCFANGTPEYFHHVKRGDVHTLADNLMRKFLNYVGWAGSIDLTSTAVHEKYTITPYDYNGDGAKDSEYISVNISIDNFKTSEGTNASGTSNSIFATKSATNYHALCISSYVAKPKPVPPKPIVKPTPPKTLEKPTAATLQPAAEPVNAKRPGEIWSTAPLSYKAFIEMVTPYKTNPALSMDDYIEGLKGINTDPVVRAFLENKDTLPPRTPVYTQKQ